MSGNDERNKTWGMRQREDLDEIKADIIWWERRSLASGFAIIVDLLFIFVFGGIGADYIAVAFAGLACVFAYAWVFFNEGWQKKQSELTHHVNTGFVYLGRRTDER